jgi:RNA polymerase-interacting CarD/CdnL/TRCF family regulator
MMRKIGIRYYVVRIAIRDFSVQIPSHDMKTYAILEVELLSLFISALDGGHF